VITVDLPTRGLPAGKGLTFNDSLTLTMKTGAANVTTVDGATERLTLTTDGKTKFNFPVSLGKATTSNGCTNLNVAAAQEYFNFAQIGDVALYRNTGGGPIPSWDGYGDWNTPWSTWTRGGLLANS